jgi:hypothetical protein
VIFCSVAWQQAENLMLCCMAAGRKYTYVSV